MGGDTSQVNIPGTAPTTGGAGLREFTPCSLDSPQNSFNLGWGARDGNNRQENNA